MKYRAHTIEQTRGLLILAQMSKYIATFLIFTGLLCGCTSSMFDRKTPISLLGEGVVEVSGGCIVRRAGKIIFTPIKEKIEVRVDNSFSFFLASASDDRPIQSFSVTIERTEFSSFVSRLHKIASKRVWKTVDSSADPRVEVQIPTSHQVVSFVCDQYVSDKYCDVNSLMEYINNFVLDLSTRESKTVIR